MLSYIATYRDRVEEIFVTYRDTQVEPSTILGLPYKKQLFDGFLEAGKLLRCLVCGEHKSDEERFYEPMKILLPLMFNEKGIRYIANIPSLDTIQQSDRLTKRLEKEGVDNASCSYMHFVGACLFRENIAPRGNAHKNNGHECVVSNWAINTFNTIAGYCASHDIDLSAIIRKAFPPKQQAHKEV